MRLLLKLALLVCLVVPGWAEPISDDPAFKQAFQALQEAKYTHARELAEALLVKQPDNPGALFVLAQVYRVAEGSLPRAAYLLDRARGFLERPNGPKIPPSGPWKLHNAIMMAQIECLGELGQYPQQLLQIDQYNELYTPKIDYMKGWALMKLGRSDEARDLLKKMLKSPRVGTRIIALNSLGAVDSETGHEEDALGYFERECQEEQRAAWQDPVCYSNAAETASYLLRFERAEELWLEATRHFSDNTYSEPWRPLADLYAEQGRLPEAVAALKQMQSWRLSKVPYMALHSWSECLTTAGVVLMAAGYDRDALNLFERLASRPDRDSGTSTRVTLVEGRLLFLYVEALNLGLERQREEMSWSGMGSWVSLAFQKLGRGRELAQAASRAANLLAGDAGIEGLLRPFGPNSLCRPWLSPGLWRVFGPGPLGVSARHLVNLKEKTPAQTRELPYYQAILGETLAVEGSSEAEKVLRAALEGLPRSEVMLRARCQARLAQVLDGQARESEALPYYQRVMEVDPSSLRRCGLALPVEISSDGSPQAETARRLLGWSPRLQARSGAFRIIVSAGSGLSAQLVGPDGTVLKTITSASPMDTAREFCRKFHDEAFAPVVDLSQTEIYSIDGSNEARSAASVKEMFFPKP